VFLILNSVPVTFVMYPELIRPFIPVMTYSLDQKVMARKAKQRQESARLRSLELCIEAEAERQHRLVISFLSSYQPQRYTRMCVISPHSSAAMMRLMWCQFVRLSPAPNDMFAQFELQKKEKEETTQAVKATPHIN